MSALRQILLAARLAAATAVGARILRAVRAAPPVEPADDAGDATIAVVVPARDEATRLGPCLASLAGAPGVVDVVVVDDESSDATAEVARAAGARVLTGAPRPRGWAGKAWALQQGIDAARGDWVVCLDADTRADPRLPAALVARARADGSDLTSATGRFDCPTAASRVLHPALLTTLVYRYGRPGRTEPRRLLVNGQCLAVPREDFLADGGFSPVREHLVEDVAVARHRARLGRRVQFLDAGALLTVRMYESAPQTWRGWGRSLALPGVEPRARQLVDIGTVWLIQVLPLARLAASSFGTRRVDLLDGALLALRAGTLAGTRRAYTRVDAAYWASPLADGVAAAALTWGALVRVRRWRGRTYGATPPRRARTGCR